MSIQILNYQDVMGNQYTAATFEIYFPSWQMTWVGVKLIKTKKGGYMIGLPTKSEKRDDGKFNFIPYIKFSDQKGKDFQKEVLHLLAPFLPIG